MSSLKKKNLISKTEYSVVYSDMGGVDFSGDGSDISRKRFAYLENMYKDYDGDGAGIIESIPGYRKIADFDGACNGLYSYKNSYGHEMIVAHIGNKIYEFEVDDIDTSYSTTAMTGIRHSKSSAFVFGDSLYISDGLQIFKISSAYKGHINDIDGGIYIPTTHINCEETEQRNLLTRRFYEKYVVGAADSVSFGSSELKYVITDEENKLCKVIGLKTNTSSLYIPSKTKIGDTYYTVNEIAPYSFQRNRSITQCIISSGVVKIGAFAFAGLPYLTSITLPDTVTVIGNAAFSTCPLLAYLHFGIGVSSLGLNIINGCSALTSISYSGSQSDFDLIENTEVLGSITITYNDEDNRGMIGIPVNNPCIGIESITVDGVETSYTTVVKNGLCTMIKIALENKTTIEGKTVIIEGVLSSSPNSYSLGWEGFIKSVHSADICSVAEIIEKCTVFVIFDGRVFLSGNPYYPGYVFYSSFDKNGENNPLYFGELNYFRDGAGNSNIVSMLKTGDSLAVFKEEDDGAGSIFYHAPQASGNSIIQKIYPVSYVHNGFCAKGPSISFFDDHIFVSDKGISAIEKKTVNLERSIVTRSGNINPKFLTEDITLSTLTVWRGYLVVCTGGHIYLADSRDTFIGKEGNFEYEWYYLCDIGGYKNDSTVYRYSSTAHEGFAVHENCDEAANGRIMNSYDGSEYIYYVTENGVNYEVYKTDERSGGTFYPATHVMALGKLLFFAESAGGIYVFNNDKRGVIPPTVTNLEGYDENDYLNSLGRRIHHYYYSFNKHAPRYALKTKMDNCGIPHLRKNTVKHSLTLKCRATDRGCLSCEVGTDKDGYFEICTFPNKDIIFSDMDFSSLSLSTDNTYTIPLAEKSKDWIEKQISLYTDKYASPFGIYNLAYRFFVKGKIKKR